MQENIAVVIEVTGAITQEWDSGLSGKEAWRIQAAEGRAEEEEGQKKESK